MPDPLEKSNGDEEEKDAKAFVRVIRFIRKHWVAAGMMGAMGLGVWGQMDKPLKAGQDDPVAKALLRRDVDDLKRDVAILQQDLKELTKAINRRGIYASRAGASPADVRETDEAGGRFRSAGAGGPHP